MTPDLRTPPNEICPDLKCYIQPSFQQLSQTFAQHANGLGWPVSRLLPCFCGKVIERIRPSVCSAACHRAPPKAFSSHCVGAFIHSCVGSFLHSFIQQAFVECPFCAACRADGSSRESAWSPAAAVPPSSVRTGTYNPRG